MDVVCQAAATEKFSVIILAGGQSKRMGRDKAALAWEDSSLLNSLLVRLLPLSDDVLVVSNIPRNLRGPVREVADIIPGKGPLSGIHAGLTYARYAFAFVTACDVPFLVPALAPRLIAAAGPADGSVVVYKDRIEPLFACYHKKCTAVIERLLAEGQYKVRSFLDQIHWVPVSQWDELDEACFMNMNTSQDYEKAREILAKEK